jgi:hypothetical protein
LAIREVREVKVSTVHVILAVREVKILSVEVEAVEGEAALGAEVEAGVAGSKTRDR